MDNNDSSYEWNYQGSMLNKIRTDKHPESNTFYRRNRPGIVTLTHSRKINISPTLTNLLLVDNKELSLHPNDIPILGG